MVSVNYPEPAFRIREEQGRRQVFDEVRRKWVALTPEEWVRQNMIRWMVVTLGYPASLVAVERELMLGSLRKRFDIVVFDRLQKPWMMVECKAPEVALGEGVLMQVLRYNLSIPVPYLVISNGNECHAAHRTEEGLAWLTEMPVYPF
jgi:Type I restriction enzyme R protein N terminus (HSDR_N)